MKTIRIACCLIASLPAPAQDPEKPLTPQAALAEMFDKFEKAGITVDVAKQTVTVKAEVGRPDQPLEFLLIHRRGKAHEALFVCEAKASLLNAAMIVIGLEKGKNARIVDKDPLPTIEEIEKGAPLSDVFPPEGEPLFITAAWKDAAGKEVEYAIGDLLIDMTTGFMVMDESWIYLGGHMAPMYRGEPPVFVGDYEGNLVSVVYKTPPNHLVTMRHERAADDQIWWFSKVVPEPETPVTVTFHKEKPPVVAAFEKRIVEQWKEEQQKRKQAEEAERKKDGGKDGGGAGSPGGTGRE